MKRVFGLLMLASFSVATFSSCKSSKNSGSVLGNGTTGQITKTVATVVGVILLSKIINSVLTKIGGNQAFSGFANNANFANNFNENTKLNSFANNQVLQGALQLLVAQQYDIPFTKVANSYSNLTTVGDLATFIGKNASANALNQIK